MRLHRLKPVPLIISLGIFAVIALFAFNSLGTQNSTGNLGESITAMLSDVLFTEYIAPFLLVGVLLVASLVAGVYLAKSDTQRRERLFRAVRKKPRFDAEDARESMEERTDDTD